MFVVPLCCQLVHLMNASVLKILSVKLRVIKGGEGRDERRLKTKGARQQVARENAPRSLTTTHVALVRHFVNYYAQLSVAVNHHVRNRMGNSDRWPRTKV